MATSNSFQVQMASIMEVLTKTALAEITKLVDDASAELRLEMCRSQRENETLKSKLLVMEGELRSARGYGEGTPDSSLNIAFEVKVCDEFREEQNSKVGGEGCVVAVERVFDERLSTGPAKDEQYVGLTVERKQTVPDVLDIKYEPVGGEQDWSGSVLLSEDWLEEDPKMSQSEAAQKIIEETTGGNLGAATAGANGGEGPLCKEEELHMQPCPAGDPEEGLLAELKLEPEGERPEYTLPILRSVDLGLELPSGMVLEEHGQRGGSAPCEASFTASAEAESRRRIEGQGEFICTCCGKKFPDALELQTHEEQHNTGKRFDCSEGGKALAYSSVHQRIHSKKKQFASSVCTKTFSQRHVLQAHESIHTGEKPHVCKDCGKHFSQKSYLKTHQRVHTREKPFVCAQCGKSFSQISNLKTHQITHTGEKCFRCTVCNKTCASFSVLLEHHQGVHAGEKCLLCKLCGKLFDGANSLKEHHLTHHGGKLFSCTLCGKGFTAKSSLKSHQSVHTGKKPHSCNECGKCFAQLCHLKYHQSVHTGEKPHSCDECGKSFHQLCNLKTHQRVHTGEKPHSCDKCGKRFAYLHVLKHHQRVHTGEKPHSCNECGKSFAKLCHLKSHQNVHTGEKLHSCDKCGKSFAYLHVLKHHQRVHTGEKPHRCIECGKSFSQLSNLKTHQRVHTGEKPFSCSQCGRGFSWNNVLQRHILSHTKAYTIRGTLN